MHLNDSISYVWSRRFMILLVVIGLVGTTLFVADSGISETARRWGYGALWWIGFPLAVYFLVCLYLALSADPDLDEKTRSRLKARVAFLGPAGAIEVFLELRRRPGR